MQSKQELLFSTNIHYKYYKLKINSQTRQENQMISFKQQETLFEILSSKDQTLDKYVDKFSKAFGSQSLFTFRMCYSISNFLLLNLLTKTQRIIAIFLLFDSYKSEIPKKNPFIGTFIDITQKTSEQFQIKYICELLFENKRDKYAKLKFDAILQQAQLFTERYKLRQDLQILKKSCVQNIPRNFSSSIHNFISESAYQKKKKIPEQNVNRQTIKQAQSSADQYNSNFLRPLPKLIQINSSQLFWISPGIISDVMWDFTIQRQKRLNRVKSYVKKSQKDQLTAQQSKQSIKLLDDHPYMISLIDVNNICQIAIRNPYLASQLFIRLTKSQIFSSILQKMINIQLHMNTIDTFYRIITKVDLPQRILNLYIINSMYKCCNQINESIAQQKVARLLSILLKCLLKNNLINGKDVQGEFRIFFDNFSKISEVTAVHKILYQNH